MGRISIEDSLKSLKEPNRFHLVHEAVRIAKKAPLTGMKHKPDVWALKIIAERKY